MANSFDFEVGRLYYGDFLPPDRFLVNDGGAGRPWASNRGDLNPVIKIINRSGYDVYLKDFVFYITNGVTVENENQGGNVVLFKGPGEIPRTVPKFRNGTTIESTAHLKISQRDDATNSFTFSLPPRLEGYTQAVPLLEDDSYWYPRTADKDGNWIPGESPTPGIISEDRQHVTVVFPTPMLICNNDFVYLNVECYWGQESVNPNRSLYRVIQWYPGYSIDTTDRLYIKISWNLDGGSMGPYVNPISWEKLHNPRIAIPPDSPVKDGYDFVGWYDDEGHKPEEITDVTENKTFNARWERVSGGAFRRYQASTREWRPVMDVMVYDKPNRKWIPITHYKLFKEGEGWVDYSTENS